MGSRSAIICAVIGIIGATTGGTVSKAVASDIIDEWASVKAPAAPELKPMTVDPKTTALLMLDFMNQSFGKQPTLLSLYSGDKETAWRGSRCKGHCGL